MKAEVVAVGSELLLGQITDTNSAWIGQQLALAGIDSHYQTKVGDNLERIVEVLNVALSRSDVVIVCGGLGPTQDDITREAIAACLKVDLQRDQKVLRTIEAMFLSRGRSMPANNKRQADVPKGAYLNPVMPGTAAGLICPVKKRDATKVIYAVPGVPWEMREMVLKGVLPDLRDRFAIEGVICSRILRTWGISESALAEKLDKKITQLNDNPTATIAFLASGIEGLKVRITAKAHSESDAQTILDDQEAQVRSILGEVVFGVDDDTMESVVLSQLHAKQLTLALAESFTGGLIASRIVAVAGCSDVFRGALVPYHLDLKRSQLGVVATEVVSEQAVVEMAQGVCRIFDADVGIATSGVAGPDPHEGTEVGVVCLAVSVCGADRAITTKLPYNRSLVRQLASISALDMLRICLTK